MKTILKSTMAALSFAILAAFAFSGCESIGGGSTGGTHEMGGQKTGSYRMRDQNMPGRR